MKKYLTIKYIFIGVGIILIDVIVYVFLGIILMDYTDFYDESKGEYWSLASMNTFQKSTYITFNFWIFLNITFLGFIMYKLIKWYKQKRENKT